MVERVVKNKTQSELTMPICKVVAIIPAYNEDRLIGSVVLKARQYAQDVIVVDDGSTDDTAAVAQSAGADVIRHEKNMGKGKALSAGLSKARLLDPDAVVVIDADGQHDPAEIPAVAAQILSCGRCTRDCSWNQEKLSPDLEGSQEVSQGENVKADIVIGSRYLENNSEVPKHRILGHWAFNWVTQISSGVKSTDSQSGFRAFSPKALGVLAFSSDGFSVESEMQMLVKEHNLKLVETPITIQYNEQPKRNVIGHGLQVLNGIIHLIGQYRPLLFFGLPGFILMLASIGMGALVVDIFRRVGELAVGYAMVSVLFSVVGMVSFSTGIILHSMRLLLNDKFRSFQTSRRGHD